jgi:site-specific DNA-methyltransferase (adenine-specific)
VAHVFDFASKKMKPYYQQDGVTIYHADCRDVLPDLQADAMLTDPPFGVGKADWDTAPLLPPCVPCATLGLIPGTHQLALCPPIIDGLAYRWTISAHLINGMAFGKISRANWTACMIYAKPELKLFAKRSDCQSFVVGLERKQAHPSPKPLTVINWFLSWLPGDSVIDPFMGAGSTLRAAKDAGRTAIGIEIQESYCEIAAKRLAQQVLAFDERVAASGLQRLY